MNIAVVDFCAHFTRDTLRNLFFRGKVYNCGGIIKQFQEFSHTNDSLFFGLQDCQGIRCGITCTFQYVCLHESLHNLDTVVAHGIINQV